MRIVASRSIALPPGPPRDALPRRSGAQAREEDRMTMPREAVLRALVAGSGEALHGIASRSEAASLAAELLRINKAVKAVSRAMLTPFDQPGDFAPALLRNADPANRP